MQEGSQKYTHRSVLAQEAPEALVSNADGVYVDATFGRGGHTRTTLAKLSEKGRLYAFDRDPEAIEAAREIKDSRFEIIHCAFSEMARELEKRAVTRVDGVLMDIGVSSPQIDDAARGFSFREDGPLDMRMDTTQGMTAAEWLNQVPRCEIVRVLKDYGEERFAERIARAVVTQRAEKPILTTQELSRLVAGAVPRNKSDPNQNPATRTFQAIRIAVNDELGELRRALFAAGSLLNPMGRLVVISFHSLEDRLVKRFFDAGSHPEHGIDRRIALRETDLPAPWWKDVTRLKPGKDECGENARARSAVMRWAVRTERAWTDEAGGRL